MGTGFFAAAKLFSFWGKSISDSLGTCFGNFLVAYILAPIPVAIFYYPAGVNTLEPEESLASDYRRALFYIKAFNVGFLNFPG